MSAEARNISYYMNLPYGERVIQESLGDGSSYYVARVLELDGCTSHGDTVDEALWNLRDAKHLYLKTMIEDGLTPPVPAGQGVQRATWSFEEGFASVSCPPASPAPEFEPKLCVVAATKESHAEGSPGEWSVRTLLTG
ncbi:type II toxin-antitoxin system HicB family antitoxin [Candidatus Palauibacter sp.]|uniref:type II toxin-antitoxin system HicB family antitoxin n=1 Tax=Candidatus Palauibacter sp. TaxID=3101350 RepID=UPI003B593F27